MNDLEFDRLLDAVSDAFKERPLDSLWSPPLVPQIAANDNDMMWALVPFPAGWQGAC